MKKKSGLLILLCLFIVALLVGCTKKEESKQTEQTEDKKTTETRMFADSCGREVELPGEIQSVAPTGTPAQLVLFTSCPDKLTGIATEFTEETEKYLNPKYVNLPVFGQFYGKNANLNMEALIAAAPDVIVDIGEAKPTIKEDMDQLQEQLGIPVVFIEASMKTMDQTYEKLGDLLNEKEDMKKLENYCTEVIQDAAKISASIKEEDKPGVYMALGDNGLHTNAKGSFHAESLDLLGVKNVAEVEVNSKGAGSEVSFEQVAAWNPEIILTYTEAVYTMITTDPMWKDIEAVKAHKVYKVPTGPFNYISDPPSVNRMIGIHWLGNLIYPDQYKFEMKEMEDFYQDFYHIKLTKDQRTEILLHATVK
ncbi:MAG: ABC transporter substrate-binding protein [Lachnospiraceae bacterium]